jgi:hypothetical protein
MHTHVCDERRQVGLIMRSDIRCEIRTDLKLYPLHRLQEEIEAYRQ